MVNFRNPDSNGVKLIFTGFYFLAFLPVGFFYSLTRMSQDLLQIHSNLESGEIVYIHLSRGVGILLSALLSGAFYLWYEELPKKMYVPLWNSHHKILSTSIFLSSVVLCAIPLSTSLFFQLIYHFYEGIFITFIQVGCITSLNKIWHPHHELFQHCLSGLFGVTMLTYPIFLEQIKKFTESSIDLQLRSLYIITAAINALFGFFLVVLPTPDRNEEPKKSEKQLQKERRRRRRRARQRKRRRRKIRRERRMKRLLLMRNNGGSSGTDDSSALSTITTSTIASSVPSTTSSTISTSPADDPGLLTFMQIVESLFTRRVVIHLFTGITGFVVVGMVNCYEIHLIKYCQNTRIVKDSDLELMEMVFHITLTACRFIAALMTPVANNWIVLSTNMTGMAAAVGIFLAHPNDSFVAWSSTILFAMFAAPMSSGLLVFPQSTFGFRLTPTMTSFLYGMQILGEYVFSFLFSLVIQTKLGTFGFLVVSFYSMLASITLFMAVLVIGGVIQKKSKLVRDRKVRLERRVERRLKKRKNTGLTPISTSPNTSPFPSSDSLSSSSSSKKVFISRPFPSSSSSTSLSSSTRSLKSSKSNSGNENNDIQKWRRNNNKKRKRKSFSRSRKKKIPQQPVLDDGVRGWIVLMNKVILVWKNPTVRYWFPILSNLLIPGCTLLVLVLWVFIVLSVKNVILSLRDGTW